MSTQSAKRSRQNRISRFDGEAKVHHAAGSVVHAMMEGLEDRRMLSASVLRPDHVVIVIEEDRFADALGDSAHLPYVNQLAQTALVYTNSHGVGHPSEPNYLALFSGSTQGVTDNGTNHNFPGVQNLASQLNSSTYNAQYQSFAGYSENLPHDGDTTTKIAGDPNNLSAPPDLYVRNYNPMAMFSNVGTQNGVSVPNSAVNLRFSDFPTSANYNNLANVSFVIPNNLHNTHGSNEQAPWAADPSDYDQLRTAADTWLQQNISAYAQWATTHNSLLIITGDEEETDSTPTSSIDTLITGDPRLFVAGTNSTSINHFTLNRTLEDMYSLSYLGVTGGVAGLNANASGQLVPDGSVNNQITSTSLSSTSPSSVFKQSVTFTATVTAATGTPSGSVNFLDGTTLLGTGTLNASGVAKLTLSTLAVGGHSVSAAYTGVSGFSASTSSTVLQTVTQASSSTSLAASANPAVVGQSVTFTATVASVSPSIGTPGGTVTFNDGATVLGTATLSAGAATFTTSTLAIGSHSITVSYAGNSNYSSSASAPLTSTTNQAATTTSLASSKNPAAPGTSVTFTATISVTGPGGGKPDGNVDFYDGATLLGSGAVNTSGIASFSTTALTLGSHSITANYGGSGNYTGSTSPVLTQTISSVVTIPPAPTGISASKNFGDRIEITWAASSGAATYEVWRNTTNSSSSAARITSPDVSTLIYKDTTATVSKTYYYWVKAKNSAGTSGFSASASGLRVVPGPANDNFASATGLTGSTVTTTGTNSNGTKEVGEPNHGGNTGGRSVWYAWTAPTSGTVTLDTKGSNFDTTLGVYTGNSVSTLTTIASNDDDYVNGLTTSKVTFNVTAGTTYYFAVDGYSGVAGSIVLNLKLV